jgi:hypothetical protein
MTEQTLGPIASSTQEMKIKSLPIFPKIVARLSLHATNSPINASEVD